MQLKRDLVKQKMSEEIFRLNDEEKENTEGRVRGAGEVARGPHICMFGI